ncbi:MAG: efflux transporter periplasmic adaptor subunit, partial [Candidatus Nephrothrix sp. EaCA]
GAMSVVGQVVRTGLISEPLQLPGALLPMEETELHAEVSGRVVGLSIEEGGTAKKG